MQEVEAVKSKAEVAHVDILLRTHHGELYGDLWRFGVNVALRISDLLSIKYNELDLLRAEFIIIEKKTGKKRTVKLNSVAMTIIERRRTAHPADIYLFQVHSNRTASQPPKPIGRVTVAKAFKDVGEMHSVQVRLGTHSMRKSRGWAMYSDGVPIEMIAKVLNHSTPAVTMSYLGITKAEVLQTYIDYEL